MPQARSADGRQPRSPEEAELGSLRLEAGVPPELDAGRLWPEARPLLVLTGFSLCKAGGISLSSVEGAGIHGLRVLLGSVWHSTPRRTRLAPSLSTSAWASR